MPYRNSLSRIFATLTLTSLLLSGVTTPAIAQSGSASSSKPQTVTVSEEFLKAVDKALIELDGLRQLKTISDKQAVEYQGKIKTLEAAYAVQEKQLGLSEQATTEGLAAFTSSHAALDKAKEVIADYTAELAKVRKQRDKARSWLWKVGAIGLVLGFAAGVFVSK